MDLLRHLSFFVAVAEEGHFGYAADRLGITQPPLSQGIQRLEARLGVVLLTRGSRGAQLTTAGAALLPRARDLLANAEGFTAEADRLRESRGALRVGVVAALSDWHVAAVTTQLRTCAPDPNPRTVITTTASTAELVDAVGSGGLDCAAVHHPALIGSLECGAIIRVTRWLLVPADHPAADATKPSLRSLKGLACATAPRSHGTAAFDLLVDTLRGKGLDPAFLTAAHDRDAVMAVAAGRAFALTTDPLLRVPGVACVPIPGDDLALRVRLVWSEAGAPEPVRAAFEAALRRERS
ncbi:LysR family transcriptional regulator [Saccharopolyspora erythraea]|uniref:LysR family transcriptional regulator n=1 Tax=Saccharopolyspora erythraea TaxID=1836 RepID=UPI001BA7EB9E|nr:LysR family transcriptional regulator [Saccharopolyspora erythraea]QUH00977.1 LysR family transcriptional regulator [Saccharopolyspora erythraea]